MKHFFIYIIPVLLSVCISACGGEEEETEVECPNKKIADFNRFLGIDYGTEEHQLESKLGKFTGGTFTSDSSSFIYSFDRVNRVPISVWVNAKTGKINTIFMEVISLGKNFDEDLEVAVQEFSIDPCDVIWFGMSANEIKEKLGSPDEEAVSAEGVTLLSYDSDDFLITVAFKIYEQQEDKCSSISINWFHADNDNLLDDD